MRAFFIIWLLIFAPCASAQTVSVKSGEHDGFSRLVFSFPNLGEWSLYREVDGYGLSVPGRSLTYNLDDVFWRIPKDRLTKIYYDSDKNILRLILNCECHAIPFELQSGILVVDIKDGIAPTGSSFEFGVDGRPQPPLKGNTSQTSATRSELKSARDVILPYRDSSLFAAISEGARVPKTNEMLSTMKSDPLLDLLKKDLLRQISRGVAEGSVDVTDALTARDPTRSKKPINANIRMGSEPSASSDRPIPPSGHMTGNGDMCFLDTQLAIADWANGSEVASEIATFSTNLVGEFDRADPEAISRAVRYLISLGFGAEARLILKSFKSSFPDRRIWETMSYIVDLESPPGDVLTGMEVCNTSAALWAVLAKPNMVPSRRMDVQAVLRAFSAMPIHLRRHLGPELASRFLAMNDTESARTIRDAILRSPGEPGPSVQLLEAEIDLANGNRTSAESQLEDLSSSSGGVAIRAIISLIETQVSDGKEIGGDLTISAEALLQEAEGGQDERSIKNALALAYASQNRFDAAFGLVNLNDLDALPVWKVLAERGSDDAILQWAIAKKNAALPLLTSELDETLARRLLDLGFPDHALKWLGAERMKKREPSESAVLLTAEAEMSLGDSLAALSILEPLKSEKASKLRARVLAAMHNSDAVEQLSQTNQPMEAAQAARQQRNWSKLAELNLAGMWAAAMSLTSAEYSQDSPADTSSRPVGTEPAAKGILTQTRDLLSESATARETLDQLLSQHAIIE